MPARERREHILEKAAEVFARKGYRMASVSDIVEEAGIGRGTFYLYFDSKKEIFLELIEAYFRGFAEVLQRNHEYLENAFKSGRLILKTWRDNMIRILEYHRDNPSLTSIAYREALGKDEDFSYRVEELESLARGYLLQEFQMMHERKMIRDCDLDLVTTMVIGAMVNVIMDHLYKGNGRELNELVNSMVEYNIRALIPPAGNVQRALRSALGRD
jgi:AcrR family transcriptional regulator